MQSGFVEKVKLVRKTPNAIEDVRSGNIGTMRSGSDVAVRYVGRIVSRRSDLFVSLQANCRKDFRHKVEKRLTVRFSKQRKGKQVGAGQIISRVEEWKPDTRVEVRHVETNGRNVTRNSEHPRFLRNVGNDPQANSMRDARETRDLPIAQTTSLLNAFSTREICQNERAAASSDTT